jgi:tetratricopeptide (TPR) repeat protein
VDLQALYTHAVAAHRQGNLAAAEEGYLRLLAAEPGNPQICHPLGVLRAQQGRVDEALALLESVVAQCPADTGVLKDYAMVLAGAGHNDAALAAFDRALALAPGDGELVQLRIEALLRLKRHAEVLAATDAALAVQPSSVILLHQRGLALAGLGRHADAESCFARVLALKPDSDAALYDRGAALAAQHRIADWFASFHAFAQAGAKKPAAEITPLKTLHDAEQKVWLRGQGITPAAPLHIEGGERLDGPAINPANAQDAARQWGENRPQVVVVDNLLTDAALAALRRFCIGSTIWSTGYGSGYLGTFPEHGFSVPLLAQIAEEFRTVYSGICGDLPLKYAWAFAYDSRMDEGVHIHADDAAVNVNFWITPDEANLDPAHGGLLVWDIPAPGDWDFTRFNRDQPAIRDFLARNNAKASTVPYRGNRAVIFDSNLLHKTDRIRFRDGLENRRINVTLLYGERRAGTLV